MNNILIYEISCHYANNKFYVCYDNNYQIFLKKNRFILNFSKIDDYHYKTEHTEFTIEEFNDILKNKYFVLVKNLELEIKQQKILINDNLYYCDDQHIYWSNDNKKIFIPHNPKNTKPIGCGWVLCKLSIFYSILNKIYLSPRMFIIGTFV